MSKRVRYVAGLLFLFGSCALATAQPAEGTYLKAIVPQAEPVKVKPGGFADVSVEVPEGGAVNWRFSSPPVAVADGLPEGRMIFGGQPGTTITATATIVVVDVDFEKKKLKTRFIVKEFPHTFLADGGTVPPPKPVDPKDPPVTPTTGLYFAVVGADGPASPDVTKSLLLPEWSTLTKAGHTFKYFTQSDAARLGFKTAGASPPFVVILRPRADGKSSEQIGQPFPLPKTGAEVLELPNKAK